MDNYFIINLQKPANFINLQCKPIIIVDEPDEEVWTTVMNYNEEFDYYYLHEDLETKIFKYTSNTKYEYLVAQVLEYDHECGHRIYYDYYLFSNKEQYNFTKSLFKDRIEFECKYYNEKIEETNRLLFYVFSSFNIKRIVLNGINIQDLFIGGSYLSFKYHCTKSNRIIVVEIDRNEFHVVNNILYKRIQIEPLEYKETKKDEKIIYTYISPIIKLAIRDE